MKRIITRILGASALFMIATLPMHASAQGVNCATPLIGTGQVQACQAANKGVDDLRRFIQRTRGIYILYMQDFAADVRAA